jgi:hypothetical protein
VITLAHPEVLVSGPVHAAVHAYVHTPVHHAVAAASAPPRHAQTSSSDENI